MCSELGAVPLLIFALFSSSFAVAGTRPLLVAILVFTAISVSLTAWQGSLDDRLFVILCAGGMIGVAGSAAVIADQGTSHAVLVLLAAIPALAAMGSSGRTVVGFMTFAVTLGLAVVAVRAASLTDLLVGGGAVIMAVIAPTLMVTMLRRNLSDLIHEQATLSLIDPLTGALNRRGLFDGAPTVFEEAQQSGQMIGMLVIDIDHFKRVNDALGHSAGDEVLVDITSVLHEEVGDRGIVARTGGEEFTILFGVADAAELEAVSTRLRLAVGSRSEVTVSVGGVCAPLRRLDAPLHPDAQTLLDDLARPADQRLYAAKALGRNRSMVSQIPTVEWYFDDPEATSATSDDGTARQVRATSALVSAVAPRSAGATTRAPRAASTRAESERRTPTQSRSVRFVDVDEATFEILHPGRDADRIRQLTSSNVYEVVDIWPDAVAELRQLDALDHVEPGVHPAVPLDYDDPAVVDEHTRYVVFPWRRRVVRMPDSATFYRLKTARNRFLVTGAEQRRWDETIIAVAGLSVGSSAVSACSLTGARHFRLADPDTLAATNLNRMSGSVCDVGTSKLDLTVRRLLEADPYTVIESFADGYTPTTADRFLATSESGPRTIVIEEIDDVAAKIDMRRRAQALRIPVISATDMGDNVILDIERYDLDPTYPIFHGRVEQFTAGDPGDPAQRLRMAASIVGDVLTPRMAFSASQIGRGVASWPQLGSTGAMAGAFAAAAARNIVCGHRVESGRHVLDIEQMLNAGDGGSAWNELDPDVVAGRHTDGPGTWDREKPPA
ncbi:diguanylate cyclase [Gordonia sp. VNK1]|uniref:diguanylate cyclase n=1 Tax=Gordonia oleivorans TaxID=3156618 RepID=UPI0032B36FA1